ncbi:uncharacterized protein LOC127445448 isoform X1 [Myxocyprinus asiaticus]|uniref:uncharacterized protein LOC127445448 isoform X1 n=1 Tax=Myxocyprinus asiaticus TaxID=70543 RepID=UPI002223D287|nr:uncharacterized protein LOC127445448 isoform X1 [Myxocyprinus asiaticus]
MRLRGYVVVPNGNAVQYVAMLADTNINYLVLSVDLHNHINTLLIFSPISNKDRLTGAVSIRAACHRTMRKSEMPHSLRVTLRMVWVFCSSSQSVPVKIVLRDSDPVILVSNWCLCEASTAVYNHIVALLFQTEHYSELDVQVVPPVHSCTETEQQWHKPRTAGVKPGPINKMVITRPRPTWLMEGGIRNTLYKGLVGDPLDISLLQIGDTYKDFDITE